MKRMKWALTAAVCGLLSLSVLAQVGKKGEVKPTPTPAPKKTKPSKKNPPRKVVRSTAPARSTTQPKDDAAANERTFWESIRNSTDAEDFREYLRQYPQGQFAGLARNRLRQLEAGTTSGTTSTPTTTVPPAARTTGAPARGTVVRNQMGMELVYIPAGSFMMGSTANTDEQPVHQVTIREGFYMGRYEVTQAQWQAVMGNNPSTYKGDNLPVETVSWDDAQEFIRRMNARADGYRYRLPSEAEWEYAARAGTTTTYYWGEDVLQACRYANVADQTARAKHADWTWTIDCRDGYAETAPVGSFPPNAFGLYDMAGNVWEWCEDWYHDSYNGAPVDGSAWETGGEQKYRVLRGGSWSVNGDILHSAFRNWLTPDYRYYFLGFRLVAVSRS